MNYIINDKFLTRLLEHSNELSTFLFEFYIKYNAKLSEVLKENPHISKEYMKYHDLDISKKFLSVSTNPNKFLKTLYGKQIYSNFDTDLSKFHNNHSHDTAVHITSRFIPMIIEDDNYTNNTNLLIQCVNNYNADDYQNMDAELFNKLNNLTNMDVLINPDNAFEIIRHLFFVGHNGNSSSYNTLDVTAIQNSIDNDDSIVMQVRKDFEELFNKTFIASVITNILLEDNVKNDTINVINKLTQPSDLIIGQGNFEIDNSKVFGQGDNSITVTNQIMLNNIFRNQTGALIETLGKQTDEMAQSYTTEDNIIEMLYMAYMSSENNTTNVVDIKISRDIKRIINSAKTNIFESTNVDLLDNIVDNFEKYFIVSERRSLNDAFNKLKSKYILRLIRTFMEYKAISNDGVVEKDGEGKPYNMYARAVSAVARKIQSLIRLISDIDPYYIDRKKDSTRLSLLWENYLRESRTGDYFINNLNSYLTNGGTIRWIEEKGNLNIVKFKALLNNGNASAFLNDITKTVREDYSYLSQSYLTSNFITKIKNYLINIDRTNVFTAFNKYNRYVHKSEYGYESSELPEGTTLDTVLFDNHIEQLNNYTDVYSKEEIGLEEFKNITKLMNSLEDLSDISEEAKTKVNNTISKHLELIYN